MVKTIQAALTSLLIIGAFCSLCVFEYPLGRPRPYFTCLYFLILWSTYTYILYFINIQTPIIISWTIIIIIMSSFGSMIVNLFRFKANGGEVFLSRLSNLTLDAEIKQNSDAYGKWEFQRTYVVSLRQTMATSTTIQQGVKPLLVTWFIIGLGFYPTNRVKPCFSTLYSLMLWCTYGCFCYLIMVFFTWNKTFRTTVSMVLRAINMLITLTSVIIGLCYDKKLRTCMKKLAAVDDTLEELGIPKMYQEMHMWSKRVVAGWVVYIFFTNTYDSFWWWSVTQSNWAYLIPHVLNHCFHVNLFVDFMFIFFMWYIGTRFDKLNENVRGLLVSEEHGLRCRWKKPVIAVYRHTLYADNYKRILWTSMHLQLELCRIARELNLIFGTQMTLEMLTYFLFLTALAFNFCIMLLSGKGMPIRAWLGNGILTSICIMRLYSVNHICESISVKANKISETIHQLTIILRYADIHQELCQLILQTMHHPLKFTGLKLFCFGSKLLWKFCTVVATFVMLTVQWSPELQEYNDPRSKINNNISKELF
ncbi:uncharacterized protein LOC116849188 [Odontomachus brunneus]|uniref:uncharacterized protein LOC116849188 n=1 Tax=Odontomachus brunneus TaxID=486640 RepID=UPI0013F247E8|nr:uncharacterized protein LOC116849188 [Odontomachus brunneus]